MEKTERSKRGTVALLILTLLEQEDMYGYQLTQELETRSNGKYTLQESSLYPTLYRLLEEGFISDVAKKAGRRKTRIYYHIEPKGVERLEKARVDYLTVTSGILDVLGIENNLAKKAKTINNK